MRCKRFREIISSFVDSEATALEQLAMQEHIKVCPECKELLSKFYSLKDMFVDYHQITPSIDVSSKVMDRLSKKLGCKGETVEEKVTCGARWFALTLMFIFTALTALTVHNIDGQELASSSDTEKYTAYIYAHVNDIEPLNFSDGVTYNR